MRFLYGLRQAVVLVGEDDLWFEPFGFFWLHQGVGHNDDLVAREELAGRSTIEANATRMALARDDVGFDAFAVAVVDHVNLLASHQSCGLH